MRARVAGLAARRSIRAHAARISSFHGMSGFTRRWSFPVPHMRPAAAFVRLERVGCRPRSAKPSSTTNAVVRDGCVAANSAVSRTRRRSEEDRFAAPEVVEHRGDAVGPLLQGRQRVRCDRIGRSGARLVEEDEPTERCHRFDPPLKGR